MTTSKSADDEGRAQAIRDAADTMGYLVPGDVGLDEWPDEVPDLPERLARILDPEWTL
jgi:hypothetical protein